MKLDTTNKSIERFIEWNNGIYGGCTSIPVTVAELHRGDVIGLTPIGANHGASEFGVVTDNDGTIRHITREIAYQIMGR